MPSPGINQPIPEITHCDNCQNSEVFVICSTAHKFCKVCLYGWAPVLNQPNIIFKCPLNSCSSVLNINCLIEALGDTDALYPLQDKLISIGFDVYFCYNCKHVAKLDSQNKNKYICTCGAELCNECGNRDHFGYTCFYMISNEDYQEIDLKPPEFADRPKNILENEYLKAKYAFNYFINPGECIEFSKAKLIVNKTLEKKYAEKKILMAQQCGGRDKINEITAWHGSKFENYPKIMNEGLKIGGVNVEVAKGQVHGWGIYSAFTPNTPKQYARDSKWIACFLAMKGNKSDKKIDSAEGLDNGKTHSYEPRDDWIVFFSQDQLLPRYLVEYKSKGT